MNFRLHSFGAKAVLFGVIIILFGSWRSEAKSVPSLSYHLDKPAKVWEETFPLGNGRIGVMPDGGLSREKYVLNESSMWSGSKQNTDNPDALQHLPKIRSLLFQGRNDEAQDLVYKTFTCAGGGSYRARSYDKPYGGYQLFANLNIDYGMQGEVSNYCRELSLADALATVTYTQNGVNYKREVIASYTDDVVAIRLSSNKPKSLDFSVTMDRESNVQFKPEWQPVCSIEDGDLMYRGRLHAGTEKDEDTELKGLKYEGRVRVLLPKGGDLVAEGGSLKVSDAGEAIILVGMKTDYYGDDYTGILRNQVDAAARKSWKKLFSAHKAGFGELFGRVNVDFGRDAAREALPMDQRLDAFARDHNDPSLVSLYYQFGRYLLIASTRPGCLPPNLQGIWANTIHTPWNGDFHLNINAQMNLWPAETGNLSELHLPLIEWTKQQVESGRHTAKVFYNSRGWVTHILGNVWQFTAPGEHPSWGATNTSAAWLCQHLYRHYEYSMDKDYLADVYPVMKEAALFFVDMLVEDPRSHYLVTAPTTSPENAYLMPNGKKVSICAGSTMDNQIIRELFTNVMAATSILGVDEDFCTTLEEKRSKIMPTTIGEDGRIMEWLEPFAETEVEHRHCSHLYGLYPGDEISMVRMPELAEAARHSLEMRGDGISGEGGGGWPAAWKINFWSRLHDGEHAYKLLTDLLRPATEQRHGTYPNLFCTRPFQIDASFGGAAGITEMLVQSHAGTIELLPALPSALKDGRFSGLCVRGGAEISAEWKDGKVCRVCLKAKHEGDFEIIGVTNGPVHLKAGQTWTFK